MQKRCMIKWPNTPISLGHLTEFHQFYVKPTLISDGFQGNWLSHDASFPRWPTASMSVWVVLQLACAWKLQAGRLFGHRTIFGHEILYVLCVSSKCAAMVVGNIQKLWLLPRFPRFLIPYHGCSAWWLPCECHFWSHSLRLDSLQLPVGPALRVKYNLFFHSVAVFKVLSPLVIFIIFPFS